MQNHLMDGVVLMPGPNLLYISGIHVHVSERPILLFVPANREPAILIPNLEAIKAQQAGINSERIFGWRDEEGFSAAFQRASNLLGLANARWGVEALHMRVLELEQLHRAAPGLQTSHAEPALDALRLVKDTGEIAALEKAIAAAETAMHALLPQIKIGMSEKQVAAMLTRELLDAGGAANAFGPIVSAGPNSASPHAVPTERPLQAGDLLVIDWGVFVDDYPSDITRTFGVGEIEPEFQRIYAAVKQANAAGKAAAKPGVTCEAVDRAAREAIEAAGFGDYFIHRTGHGLGLSVHEEPSIVAGNITQLAAGNVFTVEPGIYLPGRGGVRIEDNVVITPDGQRTLTTFPRDLITVG